MDAYADDTRAVMTLDAGGTKLAFSGIQGGREMLEPIVLPAHGDDLSACLASIVEGFRSVAGKLTQPPVAISFAFPGPADYPAGIIGDLPNLPAFRGGVALGPMLADRFGIPVFINNDGDLFAYGEAIAGFLPWVNQRLADAGSAKRFRNLVGVTMGTGFGCGIVHDGRLLLGDNSVAAEIWLLRHKHDPRLYVDEGVSARAVRRFYAENAGTPMERAPKPREIFEIACGRKEGDREAAITAFSALGEIAGDALASATTLIDGLVVIGGGLSGAASLFLPRLVAEMNSSLAAQDGSRVARLVTRAFNLEDAEERLRFLAGSITEIPVPGSSRTVAYDAARRTGVGLSRLGTSRAIAVGAYAFALARL